MCVCRLAFSIGRGRSELSAQLICDHSCAIACNSMLRHRSMDSAWGHAAALHDNVPHNVFQPQSHDAIQVRRLHLCVYCASVLTGLLLASLPISNVGVCEIVADLKCWGTLCRYYLSCDANPAFCGQSIAAQVGGTSCERVARKQCCNE